MFMYGIRCSFISVNGTREKKRISFINRVNDIIVFRHLTKEDLGEVIDLADVAGTNDDGTPKLELARYEMHDIEVIVDRLVLRDGIERRLTESIETALSLAEGIAQTGGLLVCEYNDFAKKVVLAKVAKARFHSEAVPGDDPSVPEPHMPGPSYFPFVTAVGIVVMAAGGLTTALPVVAVGVALILFGIYGWAFQPLEH